MKNQNQKRTKRMVMREVMEMLGRRRMRDKFIRLFKHLTNPGANGPTTNGGNL
jgi:hypothetical protein